MRRLVTGTAVAILAASAAAATAATAAPQHTDPAGRTAATSSATARARVDHLSGTKCTVFPADSVWHANISKLPVDSHSAAWVKNIGKSDDLHPDFGPSFGAQPVPYGMAITVVGGGHKKVPVTFTYASESDKVHYPLGSDTKIEGGKNASGDRHALVVDKSTCRLYETWETRQTSHGWTAGSGATWSLKSDKLRPKGWTSADAAGLPILPGVLRYAEVKAGFVDHAIRFTAPVTSTHYLWPARHEAGSQSSLNYPPMGARFRLKASFSMKGYTRSARVVLKAMQTYGLILADNGSPWYFQGDDSTHWGNTLIGELKTIPARDFQAVDESSLEISPNSAAAR
jgi:hypothetical protein